MRPTIRLGKIAGIEVGVHWSLLVIGALLVGSLAGGELPSLAPNAHGSYFAAAVLAVALFFASILAHELAHSVVARRQGQTVDGITLWMLGGVSKMSSEARTAGDELRVAIAGPATTMALAALFGALAFAFDHVVAPGTLLPTVACVARDRQRRARRLQPAARRAARRRPRARRAHLDAHRRSPRRADRGGTRRTRRRRDPRLRITRAGTCGLRLLHHRARRPLRVQRLAPGRDERAAAAHARRSCRR